MAESTLTCPSCSTTLRLAQEVPAGRKVKCPKCGVTFTPGEEVIDSAVVAEEPVRPARRVDDDYDDRPRRRRRDDDYDDDYDDRPRRKRQREKPRSVAALIFIILAIIAVPVVVLGAVWLVIIKPDNKVEFRTPVGPPPGVGQGQGPGPGQGGGADLAVGKPAPEIEGEDIDGKTFKLSDYRGKVVLLDFW